MKNEFNITGKVIVITGGTGVLGSSICKYLAAEGAKIAILGRDAVKGKALENEIKAAGHQALFLVSDVLNIDILEKNHEDIKKAFGPVDVLINAAGGNRAGANVLPDQSFFDLDLDQLRQVIDVNLYGTIYPTRVFTKEMVARKTGNIINFTSATVARPMTRVIGYSVAKSAVYNFTKWLAVEFSQKYGDKIRVNAICPGFFLTEQNRTLLTNEDGSLTPRGHKIIAATPFGRMGVADELTGAIHWLCSDASRFVNGQNIIVDGGFDAYSGV
jgi:NAD(P)-dependent dehydrogenase (short-subunit alcohol dehydrogenase family)